MAGVPSFLVILNPEEHDIEPESCWDVGELIESHAGKESIWEFSFENEWQVHLLGDVLSENQASSLGYIFAGVSVLSASDAASAAKALRDFVETAHQNTEFSGVNIDNDLVPHSARVEKALAIARASHTVNEDDFPSMLSAFFSFVLSHEEALLKAHSISAKALYVQFES